MVSLGRGVDRVIGGLSHLLHVRSTRYDTTADLELYYDRPTSVFLPAPTAPRDLVRRREPTSRGGDRVTESLQWHSQHKPLCPSYGQRHEKEYASNLEVYARWLHPRQGPRARALVYVHGWLEPGPLVEEALLLPRFYDAMGVDVLHLQLPFHGSRSPRSAIFHGEFFYSADLVRTFEAIRQSCIDVRTLVAWLRDAGYDEVGVTGISLGGAMAMVLACVNPTPDYIVPIVSHVYLSDALEQAPILWRMKADLERLGIGREQRKAIFDRIGLERLSPVLPPDRQLWIMARNDAYITAAAVERQWQAWGQPPIEWIPGGHMTFPFSLGRIVERTAAFHRSLAPLAHGATST